MQPPSNFVASSGENGVQLSWIMAAWTNAVVGLIKASHAEGGSVHAEVECELYLATYSYCAHVAMHSVCFNAS